MTKTSIVKLVIVPALFVFISCTSAPLTEELGSDYEAEEVEPPGSTPRPGVNIETEPEPELEYDLTKPRPGETLPEEPPTGSGGGF